MKSSFLFSAAFAGLALAQNLTTGKLGNASITTNPVNVAYVATLPTGTSVQGMIEGVSNTNGTGVQFNVNFYQFPDGQGPFLYHIHVAPVPADGNCTGTLGHLDPYLRGETPPCDATQPETCQVGDLSGKHGMINSTGSSFQKAYLELYTTTKEGQAAFFGNRSIVVHNATGARVACANFTLAPGSATQGGNSTSSATGSASASTSTSAALSGSAGTATNTATVTASKTGVAALGMAVNAGAVLAGIAAFML